MALKKSVSDAALKALSQYEGRENSFYLDSVGKVTIGVGNLVADRNAVASLNLYKVLAGGTLSIVPATLAEKQTEYDTIAKQPVGYTAAWYKKHTSLVMKDTDIDALLAQKMNGFYTSLTGIYTKGAGYPAEFDGLPDEVQEALLDMVYNLGVSGLVNKFPKFNQAIKASDWTTAATQSNRPQAPSSRNQYVSQLFTAAAKAAKPTK